MRIAVFSDIHGNPFALQAVLQGITEDGHFDYIVAAGDLAFGGSDPALCVDLMQEAGVMATYGNTEEYIFAPEIPPNDELHLKKWDRLLADAWWIRSQIGASRINWLAGLPLDYRFTPTIDVKDDLLVFHGNPHNNEDMLLPSPEEQMELFGEIRQPDDDPILTEMLLPVTAGTLAFGHFHYTSTRPWRDKILVNIAPASMPAYDKDPRARYTIFEWEESHWKVTRRYLPYDYTKELRALEESGMPHWQDHARTFPE